MNPTAYRLNGAIYICNTKNFLNCGSIYNEKSYAYIMSKRSSIDIDTIDDMILAELFMRQDFQHL